MTRPTTGATTEPGRRPLRADARRNYDRLLAAATELFAEQGTSASLDDIARRAGTGNATLYRHFPTREVLLETLLAERYAALSDLARDLLDQPAPDAALVTWLRAFMTHVTTYRGLAASVMATLSEDEHRKSRPCQDMQTSWAALVAHARQAGAVRADAEPAELLRLANAVALASEQAPEQAERLLALVMDGVRPRPSADPRT